MQQEGCYMRLTDAARFLGIEPRTLMRWFVAHSVPYTQIPAGNRRTILVLKADLNAFISKHTETPKPKTAGRPERIAL